MTAIDAVVANIEKDVKTLFKNSPVSQRNAEKHLIAAWQLEQAAKAIRERVQRRAKPMSVAQSTKKQT